MSNNRKHADPFTRAYMDTALWSTTDNSRDDGGDPLDENYGRGDLSDETWNRMVDDCQAFQESNEEDLTETEAYHAGHDFWLTRNRHGAGFWDSDYEPAIGKRLTEAAQVFGEVHLYVGDDGQIHLS